MTKTATQFELPKLPYDYSALEPHIDEKTMKIHHTKHHQGYVDKLNKALESAPDKAEWSLEKILANLKELPESIQETVRQNGGGHANHSLFWKIMSPEGGGEPSGDLGSAINSTFGSYSDFRDKLKEHATGRFGSGWAWLVRQADGSLAVTSTPNQDSPLMNGVAEVVGTPVIGLDVWEHAYYLNYQNRRPDYITAFWNIVNWDQAAANFAG